MLINARVEINWSGVQKPDVLNNDYYYELEEEIKEALNADNVELITIDCYDEDDDELDIEWY